MFAEDHVSRRQVGVLNVVSDALFTYLRFGQIHFCI